MKYRIVVALSAHDLELAVNEYLRQGWLLIGGVAVVLDELYFRNVKLDITGQRLMQTMMKKEVQNEV